MALNITAPVLSYSIESLVEYWQETIPLKTIEIKIMLTPTEVPVSVSYERTS